MIVRKAFKFRLKPSDDQLQKMHEYAGHCRFLWNKLLSMNLERLENKHKLIWYYESCHWLTLWKKSDEYGFLKEAPSHCLQQKMKDLDKAFKDAFDKKQPLKRIPKFKRRGLNDSYRFPDPKSIQIENRRIKLSKLGWMGFYKSQPIDGTIKNATVTRCAGKWYISIQVEQEVNQQVHPANDAIGIDLGIKKFVACSNGSYFDSANAFKKLQTKLAKAQRRLSKKKKFSENWKKQKRKIQKIHSKICSIRRDFQHKLSTNLSKNHAMIVTEGLKISNMSKSASGTTKSPGKNVRAKSGLNRSILDQGWSEFKRQIKYKLEWLGGVYVEVNPSYTSQKCSSCANTDKKSRISQSKFCCISCGHTENADINAAKNILAAGHVVLACGEDALASSMKQEPLNMGDLVSA
jgi:IS605 OrfB family transposase